MMEPAGPSGSFIGDGGTARNLGGHAVPIVISGEAAAPGGQRRLITIGRAANCGYQIDRPSVSGQHALLEVLASGEMRVRDLNSHNGTYLNTATNPVGPEFVAVGLDDTLVLGRTDVSIRAILARVQAGTARPAPLPSDQSRGIAAQIAVLGRGPDAEITIPHPMVSSRHARLHRAGEQAFLEDLGGTNGTFVNGQRIESRTMVPVRPGDEVMVGGFTFVVDERRMLARAAADNGISVTADCLAVHVPAKAGGLREVIGDVSLTVEPGDFVALMGPSGAGKTTLLCALNGIVRPTSGRVLYRNLELSQNFDLFRNMIGYVPQSDIVHSRLTVSEALYYTARLRLPPDTTDGQIEERIRQVLDSVGLLEQMHEEIGDAARKTLSGGQRKRVNLAMELLSDPMVLFLDEPTSGLSAVDAKSVVAQLKKLASENRTIIASIHQPSLEVLSQFNLLAMISNHSVLPGESRGSGRLVYFGPALDAFEYFANGAGAMEPGNRREPEGIEENLKRRPVDEWVSRYEQSNLKQRYVGERYAKSRDAKPHRPAAPGKHRLRQMRVLCRRMVTLKRRDRAQLGIALLVPVIVGLLVAVSQRLLSDVINYGEFLEFGRKVGVAHFLMVVAAVWYGCNNAIREVVGERTIYHRERLVNLSLAAYFGSKYAVLGALGLVQSLLMLGIVYQGVQLAGNFALELATLFVACLAGTGIGLSISSWSRSTEQAIAALPLALLPMILLGGSLTTVTDMHRREPLGAIADLTAPTRWAYEANLALENDALGSRARFDRGRIPVYSARDLRFRVAVGEPGVADDQPAGSEDLAERAFPPGRRASGPVRHSYFGALWRLGCMAVFWMAVTAAALKRDEWEWWQKWKPLR